MGIFKNVFKEIYKQLTGMPGFASRLNYPLDPELAEFREQINCQIEKALKKSSPFIFLLAPFGGGKTTQIHSFCKKHPTLHYIYKSFLKIASVEFAFLHLTSYFARIGLVVLATLLGSFVLWEVPLTGALPFLLFVTYLFGKDQANLIYILCIVFDNLLTRKNRVIIIEDLERSSLSLSDQWVILSNLWEYKRKYLISLGYPSEDKQAKLKMLEYATKLEGIIVEIPSNGEISQILMYQIDQDFPFQFTQQAEVDWLSFFTPRDFQVIKEQAFLRKQNYASVAEKQLVYVELSIDFLSKKIGIKEAELYFVKEERAIKGPTLPPNKMQYIEAFTQSILPSLGITLAISKEHANTPVPIA